MVTIDRGNAAATMTESGGFVLVFNRRHGTIEAVTCCEYARNRARYVLL